MTVRVTFRPWDTWTDPDTSEYKRRSGWTFRATHEQTIAELSYELEQLGAHEAVIQLALDETQIRRDGMPRAAAHPWHPGVIVSFQSSHGPLRYATGVYDTWHANLRAIRLALEALRAVDRYGVTRRGEQYTGFNALPAGGTSRPFATADEAARFIERYSGTAAEVVLESPDARSAAYRLAARRLHPDAGGDAAQSQLLQQARALLEQEVAA